jgi:hypothetical protein
MCDKIRWLEKKPTLEGVGQEERERESVLAALTAKYPLVAIKQDVNEANNHLRSSPCSLPSYFHSNSSRLNLLYAIPHLHAESRKLQETDRSPFKEQDSYDF